MKILEIKKDWFSKSDLRLDSSYHLSDGPLTRMLLKRSPYPLTILSKESDSIFSGNIFKRVYVDNEETGFPFLTPSDMIKSDINWGKFVSKKYTRNVDALSLREGWILVSCSGTIGNVAYANKDFDGRVATHDLIRIVPSENQVTKGFLYAYLSSKYGHALLIQSSHGGVVKHINPDYLHGLPIPIFPEILQRKVQELIDESSFLRVKSNQSLRGVQHSLKNYLNLRKLLPSDYEYFGNQSNSRTVSTFKKNIKDICPISINAFNNSNRIALIHKLISERPSKSLEDCLDKSSFFSTGSFKRIEVDSKHSIKLINQSDIFNFRKKGKMLSKRYINTEKLVEYGEVLIAGVGTLGENETFCKPIFANEELKNQLVAGEFIRMKTNDKIPSGYLFSWLSSDYGFRLIRATHTGTKLCRPIPELLKAIPVPILDKTAMNEIDQTVKEAHTMLYQALLKEDEAIALVEKEIEQWQK